MSVSLFLRRLHLYLGMALVPWFFMYAIGAMILNHGQFFEDLCKSDQPLWTVRHERAYQRPVPKHGDLRPAGQAILHDFGLDGWSFWCYKPGRSESARPRVQVSFRDGGRLSHRSEPGGG